MKKTILLLLILFLATTATSQRYINPNDQTNPNTERYINPNEQLPYDTNNNLKNPNNHLWPSINNETFDQYMNFKILSGTGTKIKMQKNSLSIDINLSDQNFSDQNLFCTETDPFSLHLNQSVPQVVENGAPDFNGGLVSRYIDFPETEVLANPDTNRLRIFAIQDDGFTVLETLTNLGIRNRINQDTFRIARNTSGAPIAAAKAVYYTGSTGNKPNFSLAKADSEATMPAIGMTTATVADNHFGEVMIIGRLVGVKTDYPGWAEGQQLYVDPATPGELTNVRPVHPNIAQWIGTIEVVNAINGVILVNVQALTGVESGTNRNSYAIGDTLAGNKSLVFDGANDGNIVWNGSGFSFNADGNFAGDLNAYRFCFPDGNCFLNTTANLPADFNSAYCRWVDANSTYIKTDGNSITTAVISLAEGLSIPRNKVLTLTNPAEPLSPDGQLYSSYDAPSDTVSTTLQSPFGNLVLHSGDDKNIFLINSVGFWGESFNPHFDGSGNFGTSSLRFGNFFGTNGNFSTDVNANRFCFPDGNCFINTKNIPVIDTNKIYWRNINIKEEWIMNNANFFTNTIPPSGCARSFAFSFLTGGVMTYTCVQTASNEYNLLGATNFGSIANSTIIEYDTNIIQQKDSGAGDWNSEIRFGLMTQQVATARSASGIFWDVNTVNSVTSNLLYCVGSGTLTCGDTGLNVLNAYHYLRFETHPNATVDFFVDDSYVGSLSGAPSNSLRLYWSLFSQVPAGATIRNVLSENSIWINQSAFPSPR